MGNTFGPDPVLRHDFFDVDWSVATIIEWARNTAPIDAAKGAGSGRMFGAADKCERGHI
jgi:hypothetical protein